MELTLVKQTHAPRASALAMKNKSTLALLLHTSGNYPPWVNKCKVGVVCVVSDSERIWLLPRASSGVLKRNVMKRNYERIYAACYSLDSNF